MIWLIYWVICGLILFGLTNPTVEIFYFNRTNILEFILSMIFGGLVIPILAIFGIGYLIKVIFLREKE